MVHQELIQSATGNDASAKAAPGTLLEMVGACYPSATRKLDCYCCISIGVGFKLAVVVSELTPHDAWTRMCFEIT